MSAIKLFYSYSQKDESYRDDLEKALAMLKRFDDLQEWHFRKILPGQEIDSEIDKELENSDIILLLVSIDFLASSYCYDIEVKKAMEMHDNGQAVVIPVILRECDWKHVSSPFKKLEGLPKNGKPIKQWEDVDAAFNDITQRLKATIQDIKQRRKKLENQHIDIVPTSVSNNSNETEGIKILTEAVRLISEEVTKLDHTSSKEEIVQVQNLRNKIFEEIFGSLDNKLQNIPSLKNNLASILFEKVYASEKLDSITIQDIQKIRDRKVAHPWYERKVIVNSITLSLLNFRTFDPKKVNLLIDFLTDFEDDVWESALVGIVLSLTYHQNKWSRFNDLKIRLQTLQEIDSVQSSLGNIELILRNKLYSKSLIDAEMFKTSFFDNPLNCFMPFYEGNQVLEDAIQNSESQLDLDEFVNYLNLFPFLDSHKYALSIGLSNNTVEKRDLKNNEKKIMVDYLSISTNLKPFQNLICEYYNFFSYYPQAKISDLFSNQLTITRSKLKGIILNKINELELGASLHMEEKEFREAITELSQLLKIEPGNKWANSHIAICYVNLKTPDYYSAIEHLKTNIQTGTVESSDIINLIKCYFSLKKFENALEQIEIAKEKFPKKKAVALLECRYYQKMNNHNKVIEILQPWLSSHGKDFNILSVLGDAFTNLNKFDDAVIYMKRALEVASPDEMEGALVALTENCSLKKDFQEALRYGQELQKLKPKDIITKVVLGRLYLVSHIDHELARKNLELAVVKENTPTTYGNLGHLELFDGNINKAIEYYKKCIAGFSDIDEFMIRIDRDMDFILSYGISKEIYDKIILEVINDFKDNAKNVK